MQSKVRKDDLVSMKSTHLNLVVYFHVGYACLRFLYHLDMPDNKIKTSSEVTRQLAADDMSFKIAPRILKIEPLNIN